MNSTIPKIITTRIGTSILAAMMSPFVPFSSGATVKESILDPPCFLYLDTQALFQGRIARGAYGTFGSSRPPAHSEVRSKSYRVFRTRQWASLERGAGCPHWVDIVAKVENRTTQKSRES